MVVPSASVEATLHDIPTAHPPDQKCGAIPFVPHQYSRSRSPPRPTATGSRVASPMRTSPVRAIFYPADFTSTRLLDGFGDLADHYDES